MSPLAEKIVDAIMLKLSMELGIDIEPHAWDETREALLQVTEFVLLRNQQGR